MSSASAFSDTEAFRSSAPPSNPLFPVALTSRTANSTPLFPSASAFGGQSQPGLAAAGVQAPSSFPSFKFNSFPIQNGVPRTAPAVSNFEASVFEKMKREEERRRALRAAEAETD
jgi:hypothetical protein